MSPPPEGRRIVCVWLPLWPVERRAGAEGAPPGPWVLAVEGRHGPVVHAADAAALALGVRPGERVADAQARHRGLRVAPADPEGDRAALGRLALWARRWCPWSAADGEDGLVMDATGSAHLHGGEAALLRDVAGRLTSLGLTARAAAAPTRGAAWALARHAPGTVCGPDEVEARLAPLPVSALRLDAGTCAALGRLGLTTVGALAALPRSALARRFGAEGTPGRRSGSGPWAEMGPGSRSVRGAPSGGVVGVLEGSARPEPPEETDGPAAPGDRRGP